MARRVSISWPQLSITVGADLADADNSELCDELWRNLPFEIVQSHPVVSGSSVTMWLPYLSKAPTPRRESIVDAPIGRIRLSQATGSKLSIQYGPGLEPAKQAVLGQIDEADITLLPDVGRAVWDNLFWRKQELTVRFEASGDVSAGDAPVAWSHPLAAELAEAAADIQLAEPDDIARLRTGSVPDAGSFDQYFSVWTAAHGFVRDFVVHTLYPVYHALAKHDLATVRTIYATIGATYHFALEYHGFEQLSGFARRFQEVLDETDEVAVVEEVLEGLLVYGNTTYAWSHQQFPWYLGMYFPTPGTGPVGGVWRPA